MTVSFGANCRSCCRHWGLHCCSVPNVQTVIKWSMGADSLHTTLEMEPMCLGIFVWMLIVCTHKHTWFYRFWKESGGHSWKLLNRSYMYRKVSCQGIMNIAVILDSFEIWSNWEVLYFSFSLAWPHGPGQENGMETQARFIKVWLH